MTDRRGSVAAIAALWAIAACDQTARVEHPIPDSVTVDMAQAIAIERDGAIPESAAGFVRRLAARDSVGTAGVLAGESEQEFGEVKDVAFLTDTSFAVLDGMTRLIHVFGHSGRHLYTFGGRGEGPGELEFPVALLQPGSRDLWVVDGSRAVHRFELRDGEPRFVDRVAIDGFPYDACVTDGAPVIHSPSDLPGSAQGGVLYVVNGEGIRESAFAVPYRYQEPVTARMMRRGKVACLPGGRAAFAPEAQNRLDMYSVPEGDRLWHATFAGREFPTTLETVQPDGPSTVTTNAREMASFDFFVGLAAAERAPLIVQLGTRRTADILEGIDRFRVHTYVVDPETGEGALVGDSIPRIMAMYEDLIAFLNVDPYPRVEVHRLPRP